jgi:glucuronoarabinoxylan endo-1,4-beta-xylanase
MPVGKGRQQGVRRTALVFAAALSMCSTSRSQDPPPPPFALQRPVIGSVDFTSSLQTITGFGFSEAFGQAEELRKLPPDRQREVLDLLLRRDTGAGLTMLRLGIDAGTTHEPKDPGGPSAPPKYVFDGSDGGQVWLAQQAQHYGVNTFIADAWTAPAFMKTNRSRVSGSLCGLADASCDGGANWTQAYTDYLLQYVRFYREQHIPISGLGFSNEPEVNVSYESMKFTPAQAVELLRVFGPAVRRSGLNLRITCCDASTWTAGKSFTAAIEADPGPDPVKQYVDLITAHQYGAHATSPQPTALPVWMTEWSTGVQTFNTQWDCNGCVGGPDGMFLAQDIVQAFSQGNINAYFYWWAAGNAPAALVQATADGVTIAKRFYAMAMISRFVLPGAVRVAAESPDPDLDVVAFRNPDGGKVLVVLNRAHIPKRAAFRIGDTSAGSVVRSFLTDTPHSMEETPAARLADGLLNVAMPRRSLVTICVSSPVTAP